MKTARKKVLVADCDEEVLIALERMLEDAGFDTTTVWTGRDVLRLLQRQSFDLILVGECLPDTECKEILQALRQTGAPTPCIVLQPRTAAMPAWDAFRHLGACEMLCKREFPQVVRVVTRWLGVTEVAARAA
jgi:DNA-binding response OmpR family regulator